MIESMLRTLVAVTAVALVAAGCSDEVEPDASGDADRPGASSSAAAPEVTRPVDEILVKRYRFELGPDWMAVDEHGLWVMRDRAPSLLVDPLSGEVEGKVVTGYELPLCQGIGAAYDIVYICRGTDLLRIDAGTLQVDDRITLHKEYNQGHIPGAFGRFWVLESDGSTLTGLDPATGAVVSTFKLPARGFDMAAGPDGLWVACKIDDKVLEVDPDTGAVLVSADVNAPEYVTVGDQLWVAGSAQTYRIDPESGAVLATVEGGAEPDGDIASDDDHVWVRNGDDFLIQIDKSSGQVVRYTADLAGGGGVAVAGGDVWITGYDDATLMRLRPDAP